MISGARRFERTHKPPPRRMAVASKAMAMRARGRREIPGEGAAGLTNERADLRSGGFCVTPPSALEFLLVFAGAIRALSKQEIFQQGMSSLRRKILFGRCI